MRSLLKHSARWTRPTRRRVETRTAAAAATSLPVATRAAAAAIAAAPAQKARPVPRRIPSCAGVCLRLPQWSHRRRHRLCCPCLRPLRYLRRRSHRPNRPRSCSCPLVRCLVAGAGGEGDDLGLQLTLLGGFELVERGADDRGEELQHKETAEDDDDSEPQQRREALTRVEAAAHRRY